MGIFVRFDCNYNSFINCIYCFAEHKNLNNSVNDYKATVNHILSLDGTILICADHGNAEQMIYRNKVCTTHSNNPVRLILVDKKMKSNKLKNGSLKDIAPTILYLLNIKTPKEYTGTNLIK